MSPARIRKWVVEQHADEVEFLWCVRDRAVVSPAYFLKDLVRLEERLEAHIDGLRIAGDAGWECLDAALDAEEPGAVFGAMVLALEQNDEARLSRTLEIASASQQCARAACSAAGWVGGPAAQAQARRLLAAESPASWRLGVSMAGIMRLNTPRLSFFFESEDVRARSRALRAAGELARQDLSIALRSSLRDPDLECRYWSAWSLSMLGRKEGRGALEEIALGEGPFAEAAADLLGRVLPVDEGLKLWSRLAGGNAPTRSAIRLAAGVGAPALVPRLLPCLFDPKLARIAGDALALMFGVDLEKERLEGATPSTSEDGADEDEYESDPDEGLPWPDAELVAKWWQGASRRWEPRPRHLLGAPVGPTQVAKALRIARQHHRRLLAVELAFLTPGAPLFETRAPAARQLALLPEA